MAAARKHNLPTSRSWPQLGSTRAAQGWAADERVIPSPAMIHVWHDVTPGIEELELPIRFHAVIEIPKVSSNEYELDKASELLKRDRVRSSAV